MEMLNIFDVIEKDYCIGCGACTIGRPGEMELDRRGFYVPNFADNEDLNMNSAVCPFSDYSLDENQLANMFLDSNQHHCEKLGNYSAIYAAHVNTSTWRINGSSGGITSWLANDLLERGEVDGVIHVKPVMNREHSRDPFYKYSISRGSFEIKQGAHSHYHVVEMSKVIEEVKRVPGNYLFIGVPCMVKALRNLQLNDDLVNDRIIYAFSLVCGHLKSVNWSLSLGWAAEIPPRDLKQIKFRIKSEKIPAKSYHIEASSNDGIAKVLNISALAGGKYNQGAMMPNACNFCDDIVGETSDLSIGDAWLPEYMYDWKGKNMLVCRSKQIQERLIHAAEHGIITLNEMSKEEAHSAQSGGYNHRREGLNYRLYLSARLGISTPNKRKFSTSNLPGFWRRRVYSKRLHFSRITSDYFVDALDSGSFDNYRRVVSFHSKLLRFLEVISSFPQLIMRKIKFFRLRVLNDE